MTSEEASSADLERLKKKGPPGPFVTHSTTNALNPQAVPLPLEPVQLQAPLAQAWPVLQAHPAHRRSA